MARVKVGVENGTDIEIYYEDHGDGRPIVLIHGYPLNGRSWERQQRELLAAGYRAINYDRRGFGLSSQPTTGYDYDTFAADLNALLDHLALDEVDLVGFSMGTGEVTRYLGKYGSGRVRKAALLGAIPPFLLKTDDNPEGVDRSVFDGIEAAIVADRYAYFKDFLDNFYNVDKLGGTRISDQAWQASFNVAAGASPYATFACVETWLTDFRADLAKIDIPVLVVHGTEDRILPYEATAKRLPALVTDLKLVPVEGGPHNIGWTHPEEVNEALLEFLGDGAAGSGGLDRDLRAAARGSREASGPISLEAGPGGELNALARMCLCCATVRAYGCSARGARRSLGRVSFGHVLNDQHRRLLGLVVSTADYPQRPVAEVDRVAQSPVRDGGAQRRRLDRCAFRPVGLRQLTSNLFSILG
jgi:non-heme chloroperoxidase